MCYCLLEYTMANQVRTFSTGIKKRLCIAGIVEHPPPILFVGRTYSGLDEDGIRMDNRFLLGQPTVLSPTWLLAMPEIPRQP